MGNCLVNGEYVTPAPPNPLPDPSGPSTFTVLRNWWMSNNFNVYKGTSEDALLWLFLRVKGNINGMNDSYLVLENFWRPPFSDEGDVLCWCHIPAYQKNRAYTTTGYEEYGISPDLDTEIYWSGTQFAPRTGAIPMIMWKRREWHCSIRIGFYRDRYMELPLGILEISSKGWIIDKVGGPGNNFMRPMKEMREIRYVFKDTDGLRFPIEATMVCKNGYEIMSYDSGIFGCVTCPSYKWMGEDKVMVSTRDSHDPAVCLLVGFLCANILSPSRIISNLKPSHVGMKINMF